MNLSLLMKKDKRYQRHCLKTDIEKDKQRQYHI